jgi:uncharacterized membrane protein
MELEKEKEVIYMMFIPLIIIGVVLYYIFKGNSGLPIQNGNRTEDILNERFATGEIDEQTYLQMKETLKK